MNELGPCRDILFDYTVRDKCFQYQCFQRIMKWGSVINLFTLYKSSIENNIELLVILFYPQSTFLLLNATANDMAAKTVKSKVLHYFKACFKVNVLTTKNNQLQTQLMAMSNFMFFLIYQITFRV